jgi:hypothetical protein
LLWPRVIAVDHSIWSVWYSMTIQSWSFQVSCKVEAPLVENGSFTTALAVVQDTYNCYSIFDFVVIVDKS